MTTLTDAAESKQIDRRRIWRRGLLAVVASVIANLATLGLLSVFVDLPADFPPLRAGAVAFMTALFTFLAVVVFAVIARVAARPRRTYRLVAGIAFVLSIIPNIMTAVNPSAIPFPFPGATSGAFLVLIIFHLVAYLLTVRILTAL